MKFIRFAIAVWLLRVACLSSEAAALGYTGHTLFSFPAETGRDGLITISPDVSINDDGLMAFVANDASGQGVFVADLENNLVTRVSISGTSTYGSEVQINNAGQVGAVSITGSQRRARIYQGLSAPGISTILAGSSIPRSTTAHFDALGNFVSLSNDGQLLFSGFESPTSDPSFWEVHLSNTEVDRRDFLSPFSEVLEIPTPPSAFFRYAAAEGDRAVVARRFDNMEEITWHDITGIDSSAVVASSTAGMWSALGIRPGISDDGSVIAFTGTLTDAGATALNASQTAVPLLTGGQGIFVAYNTFGNWRYLRLAGLSRNGILEPGETWVDTNTDGIVDANEDQNGFTAFETDMRISVARLPDQSCRVAFLATGPSAWRGVYTGRFSDSLNRIITIPTAIAVIGREIPGLTPTVSDLRVHDSLNSFNQIAFWAQAANETAVVRADRLLDPHRQFHAPWGTNLYAADRLNDFIQRLETSAPGIVAADVSYLPTLRDIRTRRAYSLARRGCLITSYTMALKQLGLDDTTPERLSERLELEGGITTIRWLKRNAANQVQTGSGGLPKFEGADFDHAVVNRLYPRLGNEEVTQSIIPRVVAHLRNGLPALLNVKNGGHWIIAAGLDDDGRLVLIDPGSSTHDGVYAANAATIASTFDTLVKARLLSVRDQPAAVVQTHSPVDFVITSPSGKKLGFNPVTGVAYHEIPESSYAEDWPINDPDIPYTDQEIAELRKSTPRLAYINSVENGAYSVEVTGIGDGPYTLSFDVNGSTGPNSFQRQGTIALHQSIIHEFQVAVSSSDPPSIAIGLSSNHDITITIRGTPSKKYQLQFRRSLSGGDGDWQSLGESRSMGLDGQLKIVLSNEASVNSKFYRVIEVP